MGAHDTLSVHLVRSLFRPHHDPHLNTLSGFVNQDLSQGSAINREILFAKQLKLVPNSPTGDANDLFGGHDGVVQIMPTRGRVYWQTSELRQIGWDAGILVKCHMTVLVHWKVAIHFISLIHTGFRNVDNSQFDLAFGAVTFPGDVEPSFNWVSIE